MKLIVAGYGFVGKAVREAFKHKHTILIVDPKHSEATIADYASAYGIIVCVPTPSLPDGNVDYSNIVDVLDQTPVHMPVLIKSTVTPAVVKILAAKYPAHSIVYNPEFLRANSAEDDFKNQRSIVLGGDDPESFWHELFQTTLPNCKLVFNCTAEEACLVKYSINSFLALKVSFFNQIYDLCEGTDMNFDIVRQLITNDPRIGPSHSMVPGTDGERGFGGYCFPKDTKAFVEWAKSQYTPATLVENSIQYNNKVRKNT